MKKDIIIGHGLALFCVVIWGTTFISTKILLTEMDPVEILLIRFVIAYGLMCLIAPGKLELKEKKHEWLFAGAGMCGVGLYYLLENYGLVFTQASNAGIIISTAPIFTTICIALLLKEERISRTFVLGGILALAGITLISTTESAVHISPFGDLLILGAAAVWGIYSLCTRIITGHGYGTARATRRMFIYGIVVMLAGAAFGGMRFHFSVYRDPVMLMNLLYLSVCASALCFLAWNKAVKLAGAVKIGYYIYLTPVITLIAAAIILHEKLTLRNVIGTVVVLAGLVISELPQKQK